MPNQNNTERFSKTIHFYHQYRPSYPQALIDFLKEKNIIQKNKIIADVGSGTGKLSELLLQHNCLVNAVEPNKEMREFAEKNLKSYKNFHSINATAENTTLPNHSQDAITAATAFHWFNRDKSKREFQRILKPNGDVLLIWNIRLPKVSPLVKGYEDLLLQYCPTYQGVPEMELAEAEYKSFFANGTASVHTFPNKQQFDCDGLIGRLLSTSYCLQPQDKNYPALMDAVKVLFYQHEKNGAVDFIYTTKLYLGKL